MPEPMKSSSDAEKSSNSGSESDAESFELPDALATGREKRQTAGNRLRDMLNAELEAEEIFAEDEEDADFGSDQDKQEDLDSEFGSSSSDEAANAEPEDLGERVLRKQEKEAARAKKRKALEAFSKTKPASPSTLLEKPAPEPRKVKRRRIQPEGQIRKRQSSRAHAVEVKSALERKLEEEAVKKASYTPVARVEEYVMTQEERMAEAAITEEENVRSLNTIVKYDEERKATQKMLAARRRHRGPVIRFTSSSRLKSANPDEAEITNTISFHDLTAAEEAVPVQERLLGISKQQPYPQKPVCAISGTTALYKDPNTGITYGDARAYAILKRLYKCEIRWNPTLQVYVHNANTDIHPDS